MAFKSVFCVVVLVMVLLSTQVEGNNSLNLAMASKALSEKGYNAMSMTFDVFFKNKSVSGWLTGNSKVTVFCPPDHAFFSSKYRQLPLTLLQYHVVHLKLEREDLGSLPHGSKIDTLLLGHPLVVTTLPVDKYASLNGVNVTEWNLYNDGGLIVHGVDNLFDPAFQTLMYPWFDAKNDIHVDAVTENWLLLLAMVVIGLTLLMLSFYCFVDQSDGDVEYECIPQQEEKEEVNRGT